MTVGRSQSFNTVFILIEMNGKYVRQSFLFWVASSLCLWCRLAAVLRESLRGFNVSVMSSVMQLHKRACWNAGMPGMTLAEDRGRGRKRDGEWWPVVYLPSVWCVHVLGAGMGQHAMMEQWEDSAAIQRPCWDVGLQGEDRHHRVLLSDPARNVLFTGKSVRACVCFEVLLSVIVLLIKSVSHKAGWTPTDSIIFKKRFGSFPAFENKSKVIKSIIENQNSLNRSKLMFVCIFSQITALHVLSTCFMMFVLGSF